MTRLSSASSVNPRNVWPRTYRSNFRRSAGLVALRLDRPLDRTPAVVTRTPPQTTSTGEEHARVVVRAQRFEVASVDIDAQIVQRAIVE